MSVACCAVVQVTPDLQWMAALLMEAAEKLQRFTPHSLANMVWALGAMGVKPNKEWMNAVLDRAWLMFK